MDAKEFNNVLMDEASGFNLTINVSATPCFGLRFDTLLWRLSLGFVSITLYFFDKEFMDYQLAKATKQLLLKQLQ